MRDLYKDIYENTKIKAKIFGIFLYFILVYGVKN